MAEWLPLGERLGLAVCVGEKVALGVALGEGEVRAVTLEQPLPVLVALPRALALGQPLGLRVPCALLLALGQREDAADTVALRQDVGDTLALAVRELRVASGERDTVGEMEGERELLGEPLGEPEKEGLAVALPECVPDPETEELCVPREGVERAVALPEREGEGLALGLPEGTRLAVAALLALGLPDGERVTVGERDWEGDMLWVGDTEGLRDCMGLREDVATALGVTSGSTQWSRDSASAARSSGKVILLGGEELKISKGNRRALHQRKQRQGTQGASSTFATGALQMEGEMRGKKRDRRAAAKSYYVVCASRPLMGFRERR